MLPVFDGEPEARDRLEQYLNEPSIYDEFLACLARRGLPVPARLLDRDFSVAHTFDEELLETFRIIYENPQKYWQEYESCEELVDLEDNFQFWRFRHMRTVQRIIGMKRGTGGSSGVGLLQKALDLTFFPELFDIRTGIENGPGISPEGICNESHASERAPRPPGSGTAAQQARAHMRTATRAAPSRMRHSRLGRAPQPRMSCLIRAEYGESGSMTSAWSAPGSSVRVAGKTRE